MIELTLFQRTQLLPRRHPHVFLILPAVVWWTPYQSLNAMSEALFAVLPVNRRSHLGGELRFFLYDTPDALLLLLTAVASVMGMVNPYFTPERIRALLAGRTEGVANVMAAGLGGDAGLLLLGGVVFISFVQAGVPLGVTFTFLISAPMVNEVALAHLFGMFGWKIALLYMGLGLTVAMVADWVIGRLKMEGYLEDWVRDMPRVVSAGGEDGLTHLRCLHPGRCSPSVLLASPRPDRP